MELNDNKYRITIFSLSKSEFNLDWRGCVTWCPYVTWWWVTWHIFLKVETTIWATGDKVEYLELARSGFARFQPCFVNMTHCITLRPEEKDCIQHHVTKHVINPNQSLTIFEISLKSFNQSSFRGNRLIKRSPEDVNRRQKTYWKDRLQSREPS